MWNKLFKNEQGFTLVITVLAIMLISILGLSLMTTTANSKKISQSEYLDQSAYYIAEAGLTLAINTIDPKITAAKSYAETKFSKLTKPISYTQLESLYSIELEKLLFNNLNAFENEINNYNNFDSSNTTINIDIVKVSDRSLTIISTGSIDGKKRTVKQGIEIYPLTVQTSTPISNKTEIEAAIKRDLKGNLATGYTLDSEKKQIIYTSDVKLNGSTKEYILEGEYFEGWTFVFNKALEMPGNRKFITSADIAVKGNLKFTGSKACIIAGSLLSYNGTPLHHPKATITINAGYIDLDDSCTGHQDQGVPSPTPTPAESPYEKSQPVEINNPT